MSKLSSLRQGYGWHSCHACLPAWPMSVGQGLKRVILNQSCTMTAKTRAIPFWHLDYFLAKVQGPCPVLSSGNATSLHCRAVMWHSPHFETAQFNLHATCQMRISNRQMRISNLKKNCNMCNIF